MASALREWRGERTGRHTAVTVRGDCQEPRSTGCCVAWRPRQVAAGEDFFRRKQWSKEQEEVSEASSGGKNALGRESDVQIPGGKVSLLQDYCSSVHNPGS